MAWTTNDTIQSVIAFILAVTAAFLFLNLQALNDQIKLTQILNQPLCAIKEIKVEKPRDHVVEVSAIIKNFGNYKAKNASINWETILVNNLNMKDENRVYTKIENLSSERKTQITILPQHEFKHFLFYIEKFDEMVVGYKSGIRIKLAIEYQDMDNKMERYSCSYLITRLLVDEQNTYEASLIKSELKNISK